MARDGHAGWSRAFEESDYWNKEAGVYDGSGSEMTERRSGVDRLQEARTKARREDGIARLPEGSAVTLIVSTFEVEGYDVFLRRVSREQMRKIVAAMEKSQ